MASLGRAPGAGGSSESPVTLAALVLRVLIGIQAIGAADQ